VTGRNPSLYIVRVIEQGQLSSKLIVTSNHRNFTLCKIVAMSASGRQRTICCVTVEWQLPGGKQMFREVILASDRFPLTAHKEDVSGSFNNPRKNLPKWSLVIDLQKAVTLRRFRSSMASAILALASAAPTEMPLMEMCRMQPFTP
jgi:hypothetical protein